jgi:hypothetical protein
LENTSCGRVDITKSSDRKLLESPFADVFIAITNTILEFLRLSLLLLIRVKAFGLRSLLFLIFILSFVAVLCAIVICRSLLFLVWSVGSFRDGNLRRLGRFLVWAEFLSGAFRLSFVGGVAAAVFSLLGLNASWVKIIIVIVDGLYVEAGGVIWLESWETALSLNLEGASFSLVKSDIDALLLADSVKAECCVVSAAASVEGANSLGHHGISIGVGAVEVCCVLHLSTRGILTTHRLFTSPCIGIWALWAWNAIDESSSDASTASEIGLEINLQVIIILLGRGRSLSFSAILVVIIQKSQEWFISRCNTSES